VSELAKLAILALPATSCKEYRLFQSMRMHGVQRGTCFVTHSARLTLLSFRNTDCRRILATQRRPLYVKMVGESASPAPSSQQLAPLREWLWRCLRTLVWSPALMVDGMPRLLLIPVESREPGSTLWAASRCIQYTCDAQKGGVQVMFSWLDTWPLSYVIRWGALDSGGRLEHEPRRLAGTPCFW